MAAARHDYDLAPVCAITRNVPRPKRETRDDDVFDSETNMRDQNVVVGHGAGLATEMTREALSDTQSLGQLWVEIAARLGRGDSLDSVERD